MREFLDGSHSVLDLIARLTIDSLLALSRFFLKSCPILSMPQLSRWALICEFINTFFLYDIDFRNSFAMKVIYTTFLLIYSDDFPVILGCCIYSMGHRIFWDAARRSGVRLERQEDIWSVVNRTAQQSSAHPDVWFRSFLSVPRGTFIYYGQNNWYHVIFQNRYYPPCVILLTYTGIYCPESISYLTDITLSP